MLPPAKDDVFRPPHWRWLRAKWLREVAWARADAEDAETLVLRKYQNARARCKTDHDLLKLNRRFPGIVTAERIFNSNDNATKWSIEARLLSREKIDAVARKVRVPLEVVIWYERTYFNILDVLDNEDFIVHNVMGVAVQHGLNNRQFDLLWKMLGYKLGPVVLDALITPFGNTTRLTNIDQVDAGLSAAATTTIIKKSLMAASNLMPNSFNEIELMKLFTDLVRTEKEHGQGSAQNLIVQNISAAFSALQFTADRKKVAVPGLQYYDEQGAELRANELLLVGLGKDSSELREAVNIQLPESKDAVRTDENNQGS
jgi:hypothetical protein